ncbi:MAG: hypothetical protein J7521_21070 [Caulobacter sp.]|nr:hypothetical protein [Caulobacter sp.]
MASDPKRGAITGGYVNAAGDKVWIVVWSRGRGQEQIVSDNDFEPGQAVELNALGRLVRIRRR